MSNIDKIIKSSKFLFCLQAVSIIVWLAFLTETSAIFIPYILVGLVASFGLVKQEKFATTKTEKRVIYVMAFVFSAMVVFANYDLPSIDNLLYNKLLKFVVLLITGFVVFFNMISLAYVKYEEIAVTEERESKGKKAILYFIVPFVIISVVDLIYLFFASYPGILSPDSISQVSQLLKGKYSNHHPFYHTILIKLFYKIGFALFGNANAAVATYSVFQIITMAAIIAFAIYTLYQINVKRYIILAVTCIFAFIPYHIVYASTMWKDILFAGICLLLIVSLYRLRKRVGNNIGNTVLFFIASLGVCLLRSNGLFAFLILAVVLTVMFFKKKKIIPIIAAVALVLAVILKGPVLTALNVTQPDTVESLSIPLQQIARTIRDGKELTYEQEKYVSSIMDIDSVSSEYKSYISDPIKELARSKGANEVIEKDKLEFVKTWVSIGLKYPYSYLVGWIDQTKGYWNSGYNYWIMDNEVFRNDFGIYSTSQTSFTARVVRSAVRLISHDGTVLPILAATGFYTWLYLLLASFNVMKKRKGFIELIPGIAIVLSLLVATPVFNEFRYVYGLYTMMPFVFIFALIKDEEKQQIKN